MINKITIIQNYLANYKNPLYLSELSKLINKPHQTIKPYMGQLVKENILIKNKRGRITDYSLNLSDIKTADYLTISEKELLLSRLSKDVLLRVLLEKLPLDKATFIVFGSFAKGANAQDIDLLMIGGYNIKKIISDFEEIYNKEIHLIQINKEDNIDLTLLKEVYKKHLILNNTEKIVRWFIRERNKLV